MSTKAFYTFQNCDQLWSLVYNWRQASEVTAPFQNHDCLADHLPSPLTMPISCGQALIPVRLIKAKVFQLIKYRLGVFYDVIGNSAINVIQSRTR